MKAFVRSRSAFHTEDKQEIFIHVYIDRNIHIHIHRILMFDLNVLSDFQRYENMSPITSGLWGTLCLILRPPYSSHSYIDPFSKHFLYPMDLTYSGVSLCMVSFSSDLSTECCQLEENKPLNHKSGHFLSLLQTLQWLPVSLTVKVYFLSVNLALIDSRTFSPILFSCSL